MESFRFELYSPAGGELGLDVASVTLQSAQGEITILPGHVGYIGVLGVGILSFEPVDASVARQEFVINGGFASLGDGTLRVLADSIDTAESAARVDVKAERKAAEDVLQRTSSFDAEWQRADAERRRLDAIASLGR